MKININLTNFLKLDYWFSMNPIPGQFLFLVLGLLFTLVLFIGGWVVWWQNRKHFKGSLPKRKWAGQVMATLFTYCSISLLLVVVRLIGLTFITARFLWPLLLLSLFYWLGYFTYYYLYKIPPQLAEIENKKLKQKYLRPKRH